MLRDNKKGDKIKRLFIIFAALALVSMTGYQLIFPVLERPSKKPEQETVDVFPDINANNFLDRENGTTEPLTNIQPLEEIKIEKPERAIKESVHLQVPFTSQAPLGVWDDLYNEACEEAALIMVDAFLKNKKLDSTLVAEEIQAMVDWQIKNWGEHRDITLEETKELAKNYYGYQKIRVTYGITIEDIKKELSQGNPVILPLAGQYIDNPYYRSPGPYYHMLVVVGYQENKFITNDPGTRRGENYSYDGTMLYRAIHDWPGEGKNILEGDKAILVIEK